MQIYIYIYIKGACKQKKACGFGVTFILSALAACSPFAEIRGRNKFFNSFLRGLSGKFLP